jgi:hypothetical protein
MPIGRAQSRPMVDKPRPMWVQWFPMNDRHQLLAAIIIIS